MSMKEISDIRQLKREIEELKQRLDSLENKKPEKKAFFEKKGK